MLERVKATLFALIAAATPLAAAHAEEDQAPEQLALLEVELTPGESSTITYPPQTLPWGGEATMVVVEGEHEHKLVAHIDREQSDATVVLGYSRDGTKVFEKVELKVAVGGDATQPAGESKVHVKVTEKKPRRKIEMPDGDDPLDGVL